MSKIANIGSAVRALIRAAIICATAFGLKLSVDQVAAVQLVAEAVIQVVTQIITPSDPKPDEGQASVWTVIVVIIVVLFLVFLVKQTSL